MSIYDDHLYLWNEGELPENYSVETLMSKHISKPRNPKIARAFYLAGFIESWGRGYEKIMAAFDNANLTRPSFKAEHGGIAASVPREIFMSIHGGANNGANNGANMTPRQIEIITMIKDNPLISLDEIAHKIGVGNRTIDREIKKLQGIIRRIGPRNGGSWEVIEK